MTARVEYAAPWFLLRPTPMAARYAGGAVHQDALEGRVVQRRGLQHR